LKQKSDNRFDTISTFNRKITRFNAVENLLKSFDNNIQKSAKTFQNVLKKYENKVGVKEKRAKQKETQILKKADKVIEKTKTKKQIKASNKIIRLYSNTLKFKIVNKQQAFKNKVEQITLTPSILGRLMASDIDAAAQDLTKEALDTDGVMMTRPSNMSSESAQPDNSVKRIIELINR
jgi:hypothetical protein